MNYQVKNSVLIWAVIILLIANIATIAAFWVGRNRPVLRPTEQPADFLTRELGFDSTQKETFLQLVKEHRKQANSLQEEIKKAKDHFFDLLQQQNVPDSTKKIAATAISIPTQQLDLLTFNHFQKVRSICNPDQQKKFDGIIKNVLSMFGRERPGGPHPPSGPGGQGGPPPPGDRESGPPPPG